MTLIAEEQVCRAFGLPAETLRLWCDLGLIERCETPAGAGFRPEELRRIWSIVSLERDLDINLPGVDVILELADHVAELKLALREALRRLDQVRRLDAFRMRVIEEHLGITEWDIEV